MQPSQPLQPDPLFTIVQVDGVRLDRAIADWRGLSRAAVLRLLDQTAVHVNGRAMARRNKGDLLCAGDRITLNAAYGEAEAPRIDTSLALTVLARGDGWLAINKPPGVPVRPHALDETGTVLNAVVAQHPEIVGVGEAGLRSGVVHRLDNDTSGVLMVATRHHSWLELREAFSDHLIKKRYLALVHGAIEEGGESRRDLSITTHQPARVKVQQAGEGGAGARTCSLAWHVVERFGERASLIEVDLHTGFLHQVRVMMSDIGHPVVGDVAYGSDTSDVHASRQMLHAASLAYQDIQIAAPMPDDMHQVLASLRGSSVQ